jgi:hypothetical protein
MYAYYNLMHSSALAHWFVYSLVRLTLLRFLPAKVLTADLCLTEQSRLAMNQEISLFVTGISTQIQSLNRQLEVMADEGNGGTATQFEFYRLVVSMLLAVSYCSTRVITKSHLFQYRCLFV